MSENAQSFYVTMELTVHAAMLSRATEAVQNILTLLAYQDGMLKLSELNVAIHTSGSTRPFETVPDRDETPWFFTDETEKSGS